MGIACGRKRDAAEVIWSESENPAVCRCCRVVRKPVTQRVEWGEGGSVHARRSRRTFRNGIESSCGGHMWHGWGAKLDLSGG